RKNRRSQLQPSSLPSYGGDRRRGRADGAGKAKRRRGEEEAAPLVLAQPARELGEIEHLAKMNAVLEEAMLVQRQPRLLARQRIGEPALDQLDGVIVGEQAREPGVGDPLQQLLVAAVEAGARVVHQRRVGIL